MAVFKIELNTNEVQTIKKLFDNAKDLFWAGAKKGNQKKINEIVKKIRSNHRSISSIELDKFFDNLYKKSKNEQGPGIL